MFSGIIYEANDVTLPSDSNLNKNFQYYMFCKIISQLTILICMLYFMTILISF